MKELNSKIEEGRKEPARFRRAFETESETLKKAEGGFDRTKEELEAVFAKAKDTSKHQRVYDEAKEKKEMQEMKVRGIEAEIGRLEKEVIELDALRRRIENEGHAARIRELLASFQKKQDEMAKEMIEVAALTESVEKNLVHGQERYRIDPVKCRIIGEMMKRRMGRMKVPYRGSVMEDFPNLPYTRETFVKAEGEVYAHLPYENAKRLEKEGKVEIVEEGRPKYDTRIIEDPCPPIVEDLKSLDIGKPVTIDGKTTAFFDEVRRVLGFDPDITPDSMYQMLFEKKYAGMRRAG